MLTVFLGGCGNAPSDDANEKALLAYQEILKEAPAIEGEHAKLDDASFDYDQNIELFGKHYDQFAIYDINKDDIQEELGLVDDDGETEEIDSAQFQDNDEEEEDLENDQTALRAGRKKKTPYTQKNKKGNYIPFVP